VASSPIKYLFNRDFSYGETSGDVHQFQIRMGITDTGTFDFPTLVALFKFQIKNGIFSFTGTVGPKVRYILNAS